MIKLYIFLFFAQFRNLYPVVLCKIPVSNGFAYGQEIQESAIIGNNLRKKSVDDNQNINGIIIEESVLNSGILNPGSAEILKAKRDVNVQSHRGYAEESTGCLRGTVIERFTSLDSNNNKKFMLKCILPQHIKVDHCLIPSYFDFNNITQNRLNYHIYYEKYYLQLNWLEKEFFNKNCTNHSNIDLNEKSLEYYRSIKGFDNEPNMLPIAILIYFIALIILPNIEAILLTLITVIIIFSRESLNGFLLNGAA